MATLPSGKTLGEQLKADMASKAPIASPTFTGTPKAPTPATGNNSTQVATTAYVKSQIAADIATKANVASPTFTGTPAAPTAALGANSTQLATTAFVQNQLGKNFPGVGSAAFSNSIWGGRNLTSTYTIAQLSAKVQAGDFSDLYVGDYITQSVTVSGTAYSVNWLFADFDYQLGNGDTECTAHHIVMMPSACLGTAQMNSSNVIDGGYVGSAMWKTTIPAVATGIKNAFGTSHCLSFRTLLTCAVNTSAASMAGAGRTGCSTDWAWYDCICNLPSEPQVYGTMAHSSSFYDVGERKTQFSLFRHNTHAMNIRANWWLSAVGFSYGFCRVYDYGYASALYSSTSFGVRPYFLFH